ncbi:hypothetical protein NLO88_01575 [Pseudomonas syringae]|nr:hypothetical protein [Pseudomonas syringae]MDG6403564.1 hypothetical protein [Pseudomonas quasicaspiana]
MRVYMRRLDLPEIVVEQ